METDCKYWVIYENIGRVRDSLKTEVDSVERARLQQLLAEHIAHLNDITKRGEERRSEAVLGDVDVRFCKGVNLPVSDARDRRRISG